jgi:hypothetical protein
MRTYNLQLPITAKQGIIKISHPDSTIICFGIRTIKEILTDDGPGMLLKGSTNSAEWANPAFKEFLVAVGGAESNTGRSVACYLWRDRYWVRAVSPSTRQAAQVYKKQDGVTLSEIVQHIILPLEGIVPCSETPSKPQ